uniref:Uncharacterized protein n=1 Tax=Octactis speculum TaxID=3111310 RepID=A0A7S2H7J0_9STRA|mmetsp:Transcript_62107/g.85349  ORF Transcript_62107/g.85349 Transcript_62107/m.85349 type:complete len:127 (+) Transcript_62107:197-577(+)
MTTALQSNDKPHPNHGIEVLLDFMSPASSFGSVTDRAAFMEYIPESIYSVLINWAEVIYEDNLRILESKDDMYRVTKVQGFQSVRLLDSRTNTWCKVKWSLSKQAQKIGDEDKWCIDSVLVKNKQR